MTDLQECRRQIDEIDSEILRLFEKRRKFSEDVANYKIRTGKPVFDAVREREKLKSLGEQAHGEFNALGIQEVFQQIMAISRKRQYQLLTSNGKEENRDYEMVDKMCIRDRGFGRVGKLPEPMSLKECALYVKEALSLNDVRLYG